MSKSFLIKFKTYLRSLGWHTILAGISGKMAKVEIIRWNAYINGHEH